MVFAQRLAVERARVVVMWLLLAGTAAGVSDESTKENCRKQECWKGR
jgi:hypothetical protein